MQEINPIKYKIADLRERGEGLKGYLDFAVKSERLVEVLRELEELSYRDIARVTGVPLGTVMSRLWRARRALLPDAEAPA